MERTVMPELLDHLPPADPRAVQSRRDLRRVNLLMGNARRVAGALTRIVRRPPRSVVELGAGDGSWMVKVARALPATWRDVRVILVDRQDTVSGKTLAALASRGWAPEVVAADALDWLARSHTRSDVMVANLFLHHFESNRLRALLDLIAAHATVFVASEPQRAALSLHASRMLGVIGCNAVTRHDAVVSVRAGFSDGELTALWPGEPSWTIEEGPRGLFTHLFVATRTPKAIYR
ncbi:MAG: methyltransferase domain-containing protein [Rhodospirillaceae bacterium]